MILLRHHIIFIYNSIKFISIYYILHTTVLLLTFDIIFETIDTLHLSHVDNKLQLFSKEDGNYIQTCFIENPFVVASC